MTTVHLPYGFFPRDYQLDAWNAFLRPDFKRGVIVHPRRNGKDLLSWNTMIAKAAEVPGLYYYIAPYYNQVRNIIWEGFDDNGRRFLDYLPQDLIKNITKNDMRIDLHTNAQIKMQGSDEIDRIVGTNPRGIVFTEYSLHKPVVWEYLRPILANNGGWAIFNGTPRGKNHLHDIHQTAINSSNWFDQLLTCEDTGYPSPEAIQAERDAGMPEELIQQEFYCSFLTGSVGTYYAETLEKVRARGGVTFVPWDPKYPVHTAWDPGITTAIWFFQIKRDSVAWIGFYQSRTGGIPGAIKIVLEKPYHYGTHVAPWDMDNESYDTGTTRTATAEEHGITFTIVPKMSIVDGVDCAKMVMQVSTFDANECNEGLFALEHHRAIVTGSNKTLHVDSRPDPKTKWASHASDAFRCGCTAIQNDMIENDFIYTTPRSVRSLSEGNQYNTVDDAVQLAIAQGLIDPTVLHTRGGTLHTKTRRALNG